MKFSKKHSSPLIAVFAFSTLAACSQANAPYDQESFPVTENVEPPTGGVPTGENALIPSFSEIAQDESMDLTEDLGFHVSIGAIAAEGPGCPEASARVDFDPFLRSIGLRFDRFHVGNFDRVFDRKACSIAMPLEIPEGFQIAMETPDILTRLSIQAGSSADVQVEAFFAGEVGEQRSFHFEGPMHEEILIAGSDELNPHRRWSQCGDDLTLRINLSLKVRGSNLGQAQSEILRLGSPEALLSPVQWKRCSE